MPNYNISLNSELAQEMNKEMNKKGFANRSEFFRHVLRQRYFDSSDHAIEELSASDPDYQLIQSRKRQAKFTPLKDLMA